MRRSFRGDDRALASAVIGLFAVLVIAALMYTMFDPVVSNIVTSVSGQTSNAEAQAVIDERSQIWGYILWFAIFLAAVAFLARAMFESRRSV